MLMAGELEKIFLSMGEGESVLVEGGIESGKELFCRLLLREALDASLPVTVLSLHPEAHVAWFREFAGGKYGLVRHSEVPQSLIKTGIVLKENSVGCRFAFIDFFEVFSAKFDANAMLDSIDFNARGLKAGRTSLVQAVNPEAVDPKDMARLSELFDIIIEVRRSGERMEYRYMRHPREPGTEWHGFAFAGALVPPKTLAEFCRVAMEYELKNVGHYGANLPMFADADKDELQGLSQASMRHFQELLALLRRETAKEPLASGEERAGVLAEGLFEERVMKEKYAEYANEAGDAEAAAVFRRLVGDEKKHEEIVEKLMAKR